MFFIKPSKKFIKDFSCDSENAPAGLDFTKTDDGVTVTYPGGETLLRDAFIDWVLSSSKPWIKIEGDKRPRSCTETRMKKYLAKETLNTPTEEIDYSNMNITTTKLKDVEFDPGQFNVVKTGTFFDEFASRKNGIPAARAIMVTGDPGVGKSSNLMDILVGAKKQGNSVLYVSAEMSPLDVHEFIQFYPGLDEVDFFYMGEWLLDPDKTVPATVALGAILNKGWDLVVFDSLYEIQGIVSEEMGKSMKMAEKEILKMVGGQKKGFNDKGVFTSFLLIQQMNKSGEFVGSNNLKHMTDAFLKLMWSKEEPGKRVMKFVKNRMGEVNLELYYRFGDGDGIKYDIKRYTELKSIRNRMSTDEEEGLQESSILDILNNSKPIEEPTELHFSTAR